MDVISKWILSGVLNATQKKLFEKIFGSQLSQDLKAATEVWCSQLPEVARLNSVEAILPKQNPALIYDPPPTPTEICEIIEAGRIPTKNQWADALMQQWAYVRKVVEEPQAFFTITSSQARQHLEDLAHRLELACQKNREIFQTNTTFQLNLIQQQLNSQFELLNQIRAFDQNTFPINAQQSETTGSGFNGSIDEAVTYTKSLEPDIAIAHLLRLESHSFDQMNDREKFRLKANLGYAFNTKDDLNQAAKNFIDSKHHQPEDEHARCLEAIGYSILGEREKAFSLAEGIREDFKLSDLGTATWIRNAPDQTQLEDIEDAIGAPERYGIETLVAISFRAAKLGQFARAEEFARAALKTDKQSISLKENLAEVILESARSEAELIAAEPPLTSKQAQLTEAADLLRQVFDAVPPSLVGKRAKIRFKLALALQLQDKSEEAHKHLAAVHDAEPNNWSYAMQYALSCATLEKWSVAIDAAEHVAAQEIRSQLLLASFKLNRNEYTDREEAINELKSLARIQDTDLSTRIEILTTLIDAHLQESDTNGAQNSLSEIDHSTIGKAFGNAMQARIQRKSGKMHEAIGECQTAIAGLSDATPPSLQRIVAMELCNVGLFREAFPIWKKLVSSRGLTIDTKRLVACALNCDEDGFCLTLFEDLRNYGVLDRELIHSEIDLLQEYNCIECALALIAEVRNKIGENAFSKELYARRCHLAKIAGIDKTNDYSLKCFPSIDDVDPRMGYIVVDVLSEGPNPLDAVKYAYQLVRKEFSSHFAHKALVISFLFSRQRSLGIEKPEKVVPGSAVLYKATDSNEPKWFIIEDVEDADPTLDEFTPEHPISRALLGRSIGDVVEVVNDQVKNRKIEVLDILSKYTYRFNRSMHDWEDRFPEEPFLWRFTLGKNDDGEPDIKPILRSIDKRIEGIRNQDEVYKTNPLSVTSFAMMTNASVAESLAHLANDPDLPIRCCVGSDKDYSSARETLSKDLPIVLDAVAISTLFLTKSFRLLEKMDRKFYVSEGTIQEWRRDYLRKLNSPREGGFLSKQLDKYIIIEETDEAIEKRIGAIYEFIQFMTNHATVVEGRPLADVPPITRNALVGLFGRSTAETIVIASNERLTFWTDDILVATVAAKDFQVQRIWTDAIFGDELIGSHIDIGDRNRIKLELLKMGFFYTIIPKSFVSWIGESTNWSSLDQSLQTFLKWFSNPFTKREGIAGHAAEFIRECMKKGGDNSMETIINVLTMLNSRPDGGVLLHYLYKGIETICQDEPTMSPALRSIFLEWQNRTPHFQLFK